MAIESSSSEHASTTALGDSHRRLDVESCEARWNMRIEAIPQIVWIADADGAITYLNQRRAQLTGIPVSQALGWEFAEAIHPDERDRTLHRWRQSIKTQQNFWTEFRIQRADGS